MQLLQTNGNNFIRLSCQLVLVALLVVVALSEPGLARVSKKFLKGFLFGAYMAKHHEPIVIHMEKSKHG